MTSRSLRLIVLASGIAALAACGGKAQQGQSQQMPPAQVGVLTARPQSVPLVRDLVGRLSAYRSADVRARVSGVLLKRTYEEGTDVKQGQELFQIDPAPLKATLNSAEAALAQAQATYTNDHIAARRARNLAPKGFVSKADLDNAEAAERTAAAAVKAARAQVESARINLGYADVRSPIDGRAGKQQVTEGALVGQGEATLLTTVEQIDPLYVNFTVGVDELDRLRRAQAKGAATLLGQNQATLRLKLPDGTVYGQPGTLDFSGTSVDPNTGAVALRGTIPNPDRTLLPGMYSSIEVTLGTLKNAFLIPEAALQRDPQGPYLLTVGADGKVAQKRVQTAGNRDGNWIVTDGISAGDKVIVSGIAKAHPGAPAKASPWSPQQKDAGGGTPAASGSAAQPAGKH